MCTNISTSFSADLAESRGNTYRFLASVIMRKPERPMVEKLVDKAFLDELSGLFGEAAVSHLRKFTEEYSGDILSLQVEYTSLFVAPLGQYVAPFEAVYRDEREIAGQKVKGLLMGQSTVDVKKTIRKIGGEIDRAYRGLPDHIGLELQVMQFLCEQEAKAWKDENHDLVTRYLKFEEQFLREHLSVWIPMLTGKIFENTKSNFFKGMACLARQFVTIEMNTFDSACPGEIDSPSLEG